MKVPLFLFTLLIVLPVAAQKGGGSKSPPTSGASSPAAATPASAGGPSTSGSSVPYILTLDGKTSSVEGVPFATPIQLQFFINDKIDITQIGYFSVPNKYYRRVIKGKYKTIDEFYQHALAYSGPMHRHYVELNTNDTLAPNPDPTGLKYILTLTNPIFLESNNYYVFFYSTPVTFNKYFPSVSNALINMVKAHNACPQDIRLVALAFMDEQLQKDYNGKLTNRNLDSLKKSMASFTLYNNFLHNIKKEPIEGASHQSKTASIKFFSDSAHYYKSRVDSFKKQIRKELPDSTLPYKTYVRYKKLVKDWENTYRLYYSQEDPNISKTLASQYFKRATDTYAQANLSMGAQYNFTTIPSKKYNPDLSYLHGVDYTQKGIYLQTIYNFFEVYKLSLDVAPWYNKLVNFADAHDIRESLNSIKDDQCLSMLAKVLSRCNNCPPGSGGECGFFKDTTGILNFLIGVIKQDSRNPFMRFFDSVSARLHNPDFFGKDNSTFIDSLKKSRGFLSDLKQILTLQKVDRPAQLCDAYVFDNLDDLICIFDSSISKYSSYQSAYTKVIKSNSKFSQTKLFSADSYTYSLSTRQGFRLSADIGVVDYGVNSPPVSKEYGNNWGRVTPYFGIHGNFKYVNSDIPFSRIPHNAQYRFSFFLGITMLSVQEPGKFTNLFGNSALLGGLGFKLNDDGLRVVAGAMLVKKDNPNPLISTTSVGVLPFVGVSYDFNTIFSNMVSLIK